MFSLEFFKILEQPFSTAPADSCWLRPFFHKIDL